MESVLELIEQGRAGYVTTMGMGGVFVALLCLYLFIAALGKAHRFKRLRGQRSPAPAPRTPPEGDGAQRVAAVAVALALADQYQDRSVSLPPGETGEPSPWKVAGRLSMMRPFVRPKKD